MDPDRAAWFADARFGMMVHLGPYTALGRGEWVLNRERMPWDEYRRAADRLTLERFSADAYAELALAAGMRYLIITAKHHDGWCLWDTKTTDWCAPRTGPRRDLLAELVRAFHARGLRIGVFVSLADWSHPAYPTPYACDWPTAWRGDEDRRAVVALARAQLAELCGYDLDVFWFDGAAPGMTADDWEADEIVGLIRRRRPQALINQRLFLPGDFDALEMHLHAPAGDRPWETDWPLTDGWAWDPADRGLKTPLAVWQRLLTVAAGGGNLLLNVTQGPDGAVPDDQQAVLRAVGRRLAAVGAGVYGSRRHGLGWLQGAVATRVGDEVFVHLVRPHGDTFAWGGLATPVRSAVLEPDGRPLSLRREVNGRLVVGGLPAPEGDLGLCIRLACDGEPRGFGDGHCDLNF